MRVCSHYLELGAASSALETNQRTITSAGASL